MPHWDWQGSFDCATPGTQVALFAMMRLCARQSVACVSKGWQVDPASRRLSDWPKAVKSWQGQRLDKHHLVVTSAKGLSSLLEGNVVSKVSFMKVESCPSSLSFTKYLVVAGAASTHLKTKAGRGLP